MREFDEIFFIKTFFRILLVFTVVAVLFLLFFRIYDSIPFQNGEILAENPQLDVKAPFEAIPESIFVKEGENVKAGDTLVILLNEQLRRDFKGTETLVRSHRATDSTISWLIRNAHDRIQNLKKERDLTNLTYQDRKEQFANQLKSVKQKVELNKDQLYKVALEKLMMDSTLFKQQVISKLEMTNSYDNFSKYKASLLESELTHKQAQSGASSLDNDFRWSQNALDLKVIDIEQRMKELHQQKSQNGKELENMIRSVNYLREQIKKQFIIAQMDGQVQNLFNVKFLQNYVSKDQLLLSIVPAQEKFYAHVMVPQRDMQYVKVGQEAHLKVEAYNFHSKGILVGRVAYVPESKPKEDFFVKVELPDKKSFALKAGYALRGEIIIERMKLYQFIAKKLFRKLQDYNKLPEGQVAQK